MNREPSLREPSPMDPARLRAALAPIHRLAFTSFVASVTFLWWEIGYARFDAELGDHNDRGNLIYFVLAPMLGLGALQGYRAIRLLHRLGRETRFGRNRRVALGAMLAPLALAPLVMLALDPGHLVLTALGFAFSCMTCFPPMSVVYLLLLRSAGQDKARFERILGVSDAPRVAASEKESRDHKS